MTGFKYSPVPILSEEHRQLIQEYREDYEEEYLMGYPEFSVTKLGLSEEILNNLPEKNSRSREQVIDWMIRNLTYDDLLYVGR